jgi:tetratricopeptide (TPR) repeat protein
MHLWADRYDGDLGDAFELQDQVASSVAGAIAPKLEQVEIERSRHKPTESLDAYDYYLRGLAAFHLWNRPGNNEALAHFYRAIDRDPTFAAAHGMAAHCYEMRNWFGWVDDTERETAESLRLALCAASLGKDDAIALSTAAASLAFVAGDCDTGAELIKRALTLNPNMALAWLCSGWINLYRGELELGKERVSRAMRLSPYDHYLFDMQCAMAFAHLFQRRFAEAVAWAEASLRSQPNYSVAHNALAAGSIMMGRPEVAQKAIARARELRPGLRISGLRNVWARSEHAAVYLESLRKAGLPE